MNIESKPYHIAAHPNTGPEDFVPVYCLYEKSHVEHLDPHVLERVNSRAIDFFLDFPQNILDYAAGVQSKAFREWLELIASRTCIFYIHDEGREESTFSFDNIKDWDSWKEWPFNGFGLTLPSGPYIPDRVPEELHEIIEFGRIHFWGWYGSGSFLSGSDISVSRTQVLGGASVGLHLENIWSEPFWTYYLEGGKIPVNDFHIFYEESLAYLMYDADFNVWCGGVEEGDLWMTEKSIVEVLNTMFETHYRDQANAYISRFAPQTKKERVWLDLDWEKEERLLIEQGEARYGHISNRDMLLELERQGELYRVLLKPEELGGSDSEENAIYVPPIVFEKAQLFLQITSRLWELGRLEHFEIKAEFRESSLVPCRLDMVSEGLDGYTEMVVVW